ncbi:hypothetical protein CONLIGDRAFT_715277 [Coniochaeta ligniaria NRRL 30616]|uniref:4'-phosphopantetheinyl transferase domain-containing protein n=1 Tax=Coniochaeta ligniaria NRRL 30616 TaxID=1408157 RepID=A0A1J7INQ0_9PEZI|nr:hypothetical protein CONLIGDRAFT_715277 [Coniochaeta ligniaria NRRL 30616]
MASNFARFPLPFKVGTDICRTSRLKNLLQKRGGERFINRILTEEEVKLHSRVLVPFLEERKDGQMVIYTGEEMKGKAGPIEKVAPLLASRFAAKEAVIKASEDRISFHDILILKRTTGEKNGEPYAVIKAGKGRKEAREALLSISHDGDYTTAVCIAATEEIWLAAPKELTSAAEREGEVE